MCRNFNGLIYIFFGFFLANILEAAIIEAAKDQASPDSSKRRLLRPLPLSPNLLPPPSNAAVIAEEMRPRSLPLSPDLLDLGKRREPVVTEVRNAGSGMQVVSITPLSDASRPLPLTLSLLPISVDAAKPAWNDDAGLASLDSALPPALSIDGILSSPREDRRKGALLASPPGMPAPTWQSMRAKKAAQVSWGREPSVPYGIYTPGEAYEVDQGTREANAAFDKALSRLTYVPLTETEEGSVSKVKILGMV